MTVQRLKTEIIAALDVLPEESLKLLAEFVAFLRQKRSKLAPRRAKGSQESPNEHEDPLLQLGSQPIVEDVTDASIHHNSYLYRG